jgi:hypothetical protein
MIYAIRAVGTDYIKFGKAIDVVKRMALLQTGCPIELQLEASCAGGYPEECWIHWQLYRARLHHRGEWFKDGEKAQEIIASMRANRLQVDGTPSRVVQIHNQNRNKRLSAILEGRRTMGWIAP